MKRGDKLAVMRWRRGQEAAELRIRQARAAEGPQPERAVAHALSAMNVAGEMGLWPGPRDPASEQAVLVVRKRWARIQKRAKRARQA